MLIQDHRLPPVQVLPAVARDQLQQLDPQQQGAVVAAVDLLRPLPAAPQAVQVRLFALLNDLL